MAKAPVSDGIMPMDKIRPLLIRSKAEPVHAAIALSANGDGLLLLDKRARPRKVAGLLRAAAAKAKLPLNSGSVRFGRAEVDVDYDPTMVRLFINKDAPGQMRMKLIEVVKRASFSKVEINVDPSLEEEPEEDGEAHEDADTAAGLPPESAPDPAAVTAELGALARRLPELSHADPATRARLIKLAAEANAAMKGGAVPAAAALVAALRDGLRDALDAAGAGMGQVVPKNESGAGAHPGATPGPEHLVTELSTLARRIAGVSGQDAGLRGGLAKRAADVQAALKANDPAKAQALLQELHAAIDAAAGRADALVPALAEWKSARQTALGGLNAIIARVDAMDFVDAPEASILLRAIAANLTEEPTTRQQVDELRRYLEDDENVEEAEEPNGFGIELDLTGPLQAALEKLGACLPA